MCGCRSTSGLVCVDLSGQPLKFDEMEVFNSVIARHTSVRLELELDKGRGWRKAGAADVAADEAWRRDYMAGSNYLSDVVSAVKASDEHFDAKTFPCVHCYGSGSLFAEIGSGDPLGYTQNRACSIQSWFRRHSVWGFFQNDTLTKRNLFFSNRMRNNIGSNKAVPASKFERVFGTVIPSSIPESTDWWKRQSKELVGHAYVVS